VTVLRFFNSVGPRQCAMYGMVLPNFVRRALANQPLLVHGDGNQTRSFTWIGDVVAALVALSAEPRAAGEVFNIGNDHEISIRELAMKVRALAGSDSEIHYVPHAQVYGADFEDMSRRVPDISKLRRMLGYTPRVQIDDIVTQTIHYSRSPRMAPNVSGAAVANGIPGHKPVPSLIG
jgi:UDP-glucose 4-epimerase